MTSLVTEVLVSAGKLNKDDWNTKISKLNHRAFDIKVCAYATKII